MANVLTVLGSSSALPTSDRFTSAHALNVHERLFLIDCGEGTQIQIRKYHLKFNRINHIFISHLHGDHFYGIFGLLSTFHMLGRKNDLHVYAFPGLEQIITSSPQLLDDNLCYKIIYHHLNEEGLNKLTEDEHVEVFSFPLVHRIPTCGFLFREKPVKRKIRKEMIEYYRIPVNKIHEIKCGADYIREDGSVVGNDLLTDPPVPSRSFAYCSDTCYTESIVNYIKSADLLYHEATFLSDMEHRANDTFHSTAAQAATIASLAGVKKLLLGHFSVRYKDPLPLLEEAKLIFPDTILASDGLQIEI